MGLVVQASATVAAQLAEFRARAATSKVHAALLRATEQTFMLLRDPVHALSKDHALRALPGTDLRHVWRTKSGRHRIFYIVSSERSLVAVLFIGYRKDGDRKDAYTEFARRLRRGDFDVQFDELGVQKPKG